MKALTVAVLIIGSVTGGVRAQALSPSEIFAKAAPAIVTVHAADASGKEIMQGSGVVIRPRVVVSNCHVIKSATTVHVGASEHRLRASVLHADPDRDLCSLSVPSLNAPAAQMGDSGGLAVGSKVYAIGAPRGLTLTLTDGLLSAKRGGLLQVSAPVSPGSSGGGLFNARGELVGITTLHLKDSQQLNFAVPVSWVLALPSRDQGVASLVDPVEEARSQLIAWEAEMTKKDPMYLERRDELSKQVATIRAIHPPSAWLRESQRAYEAISASNGAVYRCRHNGVLQYSSRYLAGMDCSAIAAVPTQSERWALYANSADRTHEVDRTSILRAGDSVSAWTRATNADGSNIVMYLTVGCSTRRVQAAQTLIRDREGRVMDSFSSTRWELAVPDSVGEALARTLCAQ